MLKLIPQENPDPKDVARKVARSVQRTIKKKKFYGTPKLRQKFEVQMKKENKILQIVSTKLLRFVKGDQKHSEGEVSDLIHSLQKSVLSLQRQRHKLLQQKQQKRPIK